MVPRDRDASFNPVVVPKRRNMIDVLENIIISFYAKGMSVSDIQEQIKELYDFVLDILIDINRNILHEICLRRYNIQASSLIWQNYHFNF